MSKQWRVAAAAAVFATVATATSADAGDYPLTGITAFTSENELAGSAAEIKAKVDGLIRDLANFGAAPADFAKSDACFFGFVKASPDGSVVTYQLDVDAAETAMEAGSWPIPVAYREVARTACVYEASTNAETCKDPDGGRFALVYFDKSHMEYGYLRDPKDIAAAHAKPASLEHDHIIDCSGLASFLEGHITPGNSAIRFDIRPLVLGYFLSRVTNEPEFAKAAEAFLTAKP